MAHQVHNKIMDLRVRMLMEDVVTLVAIILGVYLYCGFTQAEYFLYLWANAASADPRRFMVLSFQRYGIFTFAQFWNFMGAVGFMVSSFHGFSETMVSSFHRCGILTFKVLEFHGCGRFHGFIVSRISETIWA